MSHTAKKYKQNIDYCNEREMTLKRQNRTSFLQAVGLFCKRNKSKIYAAIAYLFCSLFIILAIKLTVDNLKAEDQADLDIWEEIPTMGTALSEATPKSEITIQSATTTPTIETQEFPQESLTSGINTIPLPDVDTSIKSFTDYRWYNIDGTPQKALQKLCYTDNMGLRRYGSDYIVAMGSFYSTNIGDRFLVELETGVIFTVVLGDGKADIETDSSNMYSPCINYKGEVAGNLLEFIVDDEILPRKVYSYGSLDCYDLFKGSIVRIEYIGRAEGF